MTKVMDRIDAYLALVFVSIDDLRAVAGDFGLRRSQVLLGSIQCYLDVLDVCAENSVEVSWQRCADNFELLRPLLACRVEHVDERPALVEELVHETLPYRYLVLFPRSLRMLASMFHRPNAILTENLPN